MSALNFNAAAVQPSTRHRVEVATGPDAFASYIRQQLGYAPDAGKIVPGKWIHFPISDKRGDSRGACMMFPDGEGGMWDFIKGHTIIALDYWFKDMNGSRCRLHCWGRLSSFSNLPCGFDDLAERCKSDPELYDAFKIVLAHVTEETTDAGGGQQDQKGDS